MNDISWLVYWADVLPSLATAIGITCTLLTLALTVAVCVHIACYGDYANSKRFEKALDAYTALPEEERGKNGNKRPDRYDYGNFSYDNVNVARSTRFAPWFAPITFLLALSTNLVPERETFFLLAGSEISEQAVQTPEFTKVRKVINNWLDEQVDEQDKEKEK